MKIDPEDSVNAANRITMVARLMIGLALLGAAWFFVSAILLVWRFTKVQGGVVRPSGNAEDGAPRLQGFGADRAPVLSVPSSGAT